jgi:hypothetical protein
MFTHVEATLKDNLVTQDCALYIKDNHLLILFKLCLCPSLHILDHKKVSTLEIIGLG